MNPTYVLDACGLIAFLRKEPGFEKVRQLMEEASANQVKIYTHKMTTAEVCYNALRINADENVKSFLLHLRKLPLIEVDNLSDDFVVRVAHFKVAHKISFADSFVLALAQTHHAAVVSSDHHEFSAVAQSGILSFFWIR